MAVRSARSSRSLPETYAGCDRIASATCAASGSGRSSPPSPRASRPNARASPTSDADRSGAPQPSTATATAGSPVISSKVLRIADLERVVRAAVVGDVPAVADAGGEHRGVLARAVHEDRRLLPPGPDDLLTGRVVERVVGRGLERRLVEPGAGQDPPGPVDVEVLPGVGSTRQREQRRLELQPEPQHAERLHRLVARAGQHRGRDVADRPVDPAVRTQGDQGPVVVSLDEPGTDDLGDHDRAGHSQPLA